MHRILTGKDHWDELFKMQELRTEPFDMNAIVEESSFHSFQIMIGISHRMPLRKTVYIIWLLNDGNPLLMKNH